MWVKIEWNHDLYSLFIDSVQTTESDTLSKFE